MRRIWIGNEYSSEHNLIVTARLSLDYLYRTVEGDDKRRLELAAKISRDLLDGQEVVLP